MMQNSWPVGLLGSFGDVYPRKEFAGLLGQPEAQSLPEIEVKSARLPGSDAHDFVQQQLQSGAPQVHQYDPQAGVKTALEFARWAPGAGAVKAVGLYPNGSGGYLPSMKEDLERGRPIDAVIDALGLAIPTYTGVNRALRFFDIKQPPKK